MKAESLELLEKSELPPTQARAILRAMELERSGHHADLATKADVQGVRVEMQALRAEFMKELKATTRWNFVFWVTELGAVLALIKFAR